MNKKLSMKSIQTFGATQNPFTRSPSTSSAEKSNQNPFQPHFMQPSNQKPQYDKKCASSTVSSYQMQHHRSQSHKPIFKNERNRQQKQYQMGNKYGKKPLKLKDFSCEQIIFLLKNEKENLQKMKNTVENDGKKLQQHFDDFKKSICNMADDLKLSIKAHINSHYQHFVDQFKTLKTQFGNYCSIKQQFWDTKNSHQREQMANEQLMETLKSYSQKNGKKLSNEDLVYSLMDDIQACKKHTKYEQFSHIQNKVLKPILMQANQMSRQLTIQSYYKPQISHKAFKMLYNAIQKQFHEMYEQMDLFMTDYLNIQLQNKENRSVFKQSNRNSSIQSHQKSRRQQGKIYTNRNLINKDKSPITSAQNSNYFEHQPEFILYQQKQNSTFINPVVQQTDSQLKRTINQEVDHIYQQTFTTDKVNQGKSTAFHTDNSSFKSSLKNNSAIYAPDGYKIGRDSVSGQPTLIFNQNKKRDSREVAVVRDSDNLRIQQNGKIVDEIPQFRKKGQNGQIQTALCIVYIKYLNRIAIGTKNGSIKLFCMKTGAKLQELVEHKAGVCSLTLLSATLTLVSGGDMGCCRVIAWDFSKQQTPQFMSIFNRKHTAAVTSLVDLQDSKHIMSGSFDSHINIYNRKSKEITCSTTLTDKVTDIVLIKNTHSLNSTLAKNSLCVLVGHLSNALSVWEITKNSFNSITGMQQIRKISIGSFPHSIKSTEKGIFVSGKDRWMRKINPYKLTVDEAQQLPQICQQIIQIDQNCLVCCLRNGDFYMLRQQGDLQFRKIGENCGVSYSCGISPKYFVSDKNDGVQVYMVNHKNTTETEINIWKIISD